MCSRRWGRKQANWDQLLCEVTNTNVKNVDHLELRLISPLDRPWVCSDSWLFTCQNKLSNKQTVCWKNRVGDIKCLANSSVTDTGGEKKRWRECVLESLCLAERPSHACSPDPSALCKPGCRPLSLLLPNSQVLLELRWQTCSKSYHNRNNFALKSTFCWRKRLIKPRTNPWTHHSETRMNDGSESAVVPGVVYSSPRTF